MHTYQAKNNCRVFVYENLTELVSAVSDPANIRYRYSGKDAASMGGTVEQACRYVLQGATPKQQAEALALVEKVDAATHGRERIEWTPSVAGAFPCVPEYLQGMPEHMRRKVSQEDDRAPVKLVVDAGVSGGVTRAQMARRGAAMAALAMRLSETRPVELWIVDTSRVRGCAFTVVQAVRLAVNPVSLSEVVAAFSSPEYARGVTLTAAHIHSGVTAATSAYSVNWGFGSIPSAADYIHATREALKLDPADIFITGGYVSEAEAYMRDPVAWVNKYLDPQRDI